MNATEKQIEFANSIKSKMDMLNLFLESLYVFDKVISDAEENQEKYAGISDISDCWATELKTTTNK